MVDIIIFGRLQFFGKRSLWVRCVLSTITGTQRAVQQACCTTSTLETGQLALQAISGYAAPK